MTEAEHSKLVALRQTLASIEQQRDGWEYFKRGGWAGDCLYELLADLQARARADEPPLTGAPHSAGERHD